MSEFVIELHNIIFWFCVSVFIITIAIMFFILFKYRNSQNNQLIHFTKNNKLEFLWGLIPIFMFIALAAPAIKVYLKTDNSNHAATQVNHRI